MRWLFHLVVWTIGMAPFAQASTTDEPIGRWITADRSAVIQISPCGANLCGQIVGIALAHPNDPMPHDWLGHPQCGETILETAPVADGQTGAVDWVGKVLDPRNGNVYQAQIALNGTDLLLHGYLGLPIFGQTQTWNPYPGRTLANCKLAAAVTSSAL